MPMMLLWHATCVLAMRRGLVRAILLVMQESGYCY